MSKPSSPDLQNHQKAVENLRTNNRETKEPNEDDYWPLTGKSQYFTMVLSPSHIGRNCPMNLPSKVLTMMKNVNVPVVLNYRGKSWKMLYIGSGRIRFDKDWHAFVVDNDLKAGDACVFELTERSITRVQFKVMILRSDFPAELKAKTDGADPDYPIVIP